MRLLQRIARLGSSLWYWLAVLAVGVGMETTALMYQYVGGYGPCVLCIHVRIIVLGMVVAGVVGLWLRRRRFGAVLMHLVMSALMGGLLERGWQLLGTERGWIFGSCSMKSGLPAWFALDEWFPTVFEVKEACGYTPELLFGITMAEAIFAFAIVMLTVSVVMVVLSVVFRGERTRW